MMFARALPYTLVSLMTAIFVVGFRLLPRVLMGRPTIVEREAARQILGFLAGTAPWSALTSFVYGLAAAYVVIDNSAGPGAFAVLVLPYLGGAFLEYVIPFAIVNLVVLKGVVGITSDIAAMRVSQEIDALEAVGLRPAEMVFAPRALALILAAPALAVLGIYLAGLGAWVPAWLAIGVDPLDFAAAFASSITSGAIFLTLVKLVITAFAMAVISGYFGFVGARAEQGFVGKITTSAVTMAVFSTVAINLVLGVLTALFPFE